MSFNNVDGLRKLLPAIRTPDAPTASGPPARVRTEPPARDEQHHEKTHLHRRLHSSSLRNRAFTSSHHHHYRDSAKETVQSAIELKPPISFDSLLRRDKKNPDSSRHTSQNTSHDQSVQQQRNEEEPKAEQATQRAKRPQVNPEDVKRARAANERRKKELRASLKNIEEVAMSSTRQLDDTYYTILEKASLLRATVESLQNLAEETREMHSSFQGQASKLESDTKDSLRAFENFDSQEKAITELVSQLKSSKEQRNQLDQRLEAARNRVEAYEMREKERKKSRRKRWSVVWAVLLASLGIIIALLMAKNRAAVGSSVPSVAKVFEIASSLTALNPMPRASEDPYLRKLFDEL